ncbi:MAG: hypothetical protein ACO3NZ_07615 [Pirellulales bacterium]
MRTRIWGVIGLLLVHSGAAAVAAPPFASPETPQICLEVRLLAGPAPLLSRFRKEATLRMPAARPEMTLAEVSDQELSTSGGVQLVSATSIVETRPTVFAEPLDDAAERSLIAAIQADPHGQIVLAPKVTLFDGASALVADVVSRPFLVGLAEPGKQGGPHINQVDEGTKILVRCQVRPQQSVRVDFRIRLTSIDEVGSRTLGDEGGAVQVPHVDAEDIQIAAELPANGTLAVHIVANSDQPDDGQTAGMLAKVPYFSRLLKTTAPTRQDLVILLTPRIIPPEAIEAAAVPRG